MAKRKLSGFSFEELQRELNRRRDELESERAQLQARIDEIDSELGSMSGGGGAGGGKKRRRRGRPPGSKNRKKSTNGRRKKTTKKSSRQGGRRPRNKQTLVEAMQGALQNKTMGVSEVAEAVQKNGYKTSADNFRTIVNQTLIRNKDKFKKVERGRYTTA